ncbi:MAG: ParA family protein [Sarcina sp.]
MEVISVVNYKGGVRKSTVVSNLTFSKMKNAHLFGILPKVEKVTSGELK